MEFFEIAGIAEAAFFSDVYKRYMWAYLLIAGLVFAMLYVFKAVALFTIARREGYKNRWMAFVPFVNTYYIGVVSDKNRIYGSKPQYISLAAALVEAAYAGLGILYYVAKFLIFKGGYAAPEYSTFVLAGGTTMEIPNGSYNAVNLPESLDWAWWVLSHLQDYIMYWVQLAYIILNAFVLIAFFRTYASSRYILFAILCVLLPVTGIVMFAVRNNKGKNYIEYIKEQQQRQYRMYQEYMRNGQGGQFGPGGPYGQGGSYYGGNADPYAQQRQNTPPDDPFGGLGASDGSSQNGGDSGSADPFDDLKN
ncbi:MAG: hypothetical protein K2H78_01815 [Clostridia bacterium]|nr:hypothetical protein [Clostridia bacterium]